MIEKFGGEFKQIKKRVSLGKADSLKKNYGDVEVTLVRNHAALNKLLDEYDRLQWEAKEKK
jgi:hypothetical protein